MQNPKTTRKLPEMFEELPHMLSYLYKEKNDARKYIKANKIKGRTKGFEFILKVPVTSDFTTHASKEMKINISSNACLLNSKIFAVHGKKKTGKSKANKNIGHLIKIS
ncbi:MAG: hypothetical protein NT148_01260 [Candidatus Nealsonbacteria bacterium]|nr:hypothetical protein [Candidatus Nealsonbacteria bacterium]